MDNELKTLLHDDLECSEAFLQRAEEKLVSSILALMDNILDPENGCEPDMCDLFHLFCDENDFRNPIADELTSKRNQSPFSTLILKRN